MKTDVLLLSHSRFAKEDDDGRFEDPGTCSLCRYYQRTECTCPETTKSPLLRIRWKRLIIDEGHVLGQGTTRLVSLAGRLRVERRWCVTGTVSNHMMGMDLGMERTLSGNPTNLETGMLTPPEDSLVSRKPEHPRVLAVKPHQVRSLTSDQLQRLSGNPTIKSPMLQNIIRRICLS